MPTRLSVLELFLHSRNQHQSQEDRQAYLLQVFQRTIYQCRILSLQDFAHHCLPYLLDM